MSHAPDDATNTPPLEAPPARPAIHLALFAVQVFFASMGVAMKFALRELPTLLLASVRVTAGAAVFALVWFVLSRRDARERLSLGDLGRTAVYGFFGVTANQLLFIFGIARTSATSAIVLAASIPVFTVGVALLFGRERATPLKLGGLALALVGALTLTSSGRLGGLREIAGDLLILGNSLSYAIYLVLSRDLLVRARPLTVITATFAFGALGIDLVLVVGHALGLLPFSPLALLAAAPSLSPKTLAAVAHIILFPTVGAYLLNALALRVVPASLVAIYVYAQPVIGALLAAALLDERPSGATAVAAAAIFAGIALVNLDVRRRAIRRSATTLSTEA